VEPTDTENALVAEVTIDLVAGTTVGQTWRLRRSLLETGSVTRMPIVATGTMSDVDAATGRQTATYRDHGPVVIASDAVLKPWARYSWVAEVQGAPESGSVAAGEPMAGRWSRPSDPVSAILVPPDRPEPATITSIDGTVAGAGTGLTDVTLTLDHPQQLSGGAIGRYRVRVARRAAAGQPLVSLGEIDVFGEGPHTVPGVSADDPTEVVAHGAIYQVEVIDPIGRVSDPVTGVVQ
jgi:hypothetical protein